MRPSLEARVFHALCRTPAPPAPDDPQREFDRGYAEAGRFFARLPAGDLHRQRVLDLGCGLGSTALWLAEHGARVVGVDIQPLDEARDLVDRSPAGARVELHRIGESGEGLEELGHFDLIVSKNCFEHIRDPERHLAQMIRLLAPGGQILIGFAPLWKSPSGGHIGFMTRLPWAHLLFREEVVLAERRRHRPLERATRYEDILGGLNRMTLARFERMMGSSGITCRYFATNGAGAARSGPRRLALRMMRVLARARPLREYFTFSAYGAWSASSASSTSSCPSSWPSARSRRETPPRRPGSPRPRTWT
jgi:SAM-dependent methyltransferase